MMASLTAARDLVMCLLAKGVAGDAALIYRWLKMYFNLRRQGLAAMFAEFQEDFFKDVLHAFGGLSSDAEPNIRQEEIEVVLRELEQQKVLETIPPYGEYRLYDFRAHCQKLPTREVFFACNDISLDPLQYIRSRVARFCECHQFIPEHKDEIVIAVTEAAENAVKYSNHYTIVISHSLEKDNYHIELFNGVPELDLNKEILRGKFSEDVSLMRGVLVMSKLMDHIDIIRDNEKGRVKFFGSKKVTITDHG